MSERIEIAKTLKVCKRHIRQVKKTYGRKGFELLKVLKFTRDQKVKGNQ